MLVVEMDVHALEAKLAVDAAHSTHLRCFLCYLALGVSHRVSR